MHSNPGLHQRFGAAISVWEMGHLGADSSTGDVPAGNVTLVPINGRYGKMTEEYEVLTTDEAASLLRVSTKTVLALARDGALPGEKVGRAWRFLRSDVLTLVRGNSTGKVMSGTSDILGSRGDRDD